MKITHHHSILLQNLAKVFFEQKKTYNTVVWKYFVVKNFSWAMISTKIFYSKNFKHEQ